MATIVLGRPPNESIPAGILYVFCLYVMALAGCLLLSLAASVTRRYTHGLLWETKEKQKAISPDKHALFAKIFHSFDNETGPLNVLLYLLDDSCVQAIDLPGFRAIGIPPDQQVAFPEEELRAVIGHEVAHLYFQDVPVRLYVFAATMGMLIHQLLLFLPLMWCLSLFAQNDSKLEKFVAALDDRCSPLRTEYIFQLQELRADAWSVAINGGGIALARALHKNKALSIERQMQSGQFGREELERHWQSNGNVHPPHDERIAILLSYS